jgi:hypothetical protein
VHLMNEGVIALLNLLEVMIAAFHLIDAVVGEEVGQLVNVLQLVFGVE